MVRTPRPVARKVAMDRGGSAGLAPRVAQPRSAANSAISTAATGVGRRTMRPAESQDASAEPTAIEIENTARPRVTTDSVPPRPFFTSGGRIESMMAPTSQNQPTTRPPHHRRGSLFRSRNRLIVEARMLGLTARSGAARPVSGIHRLAAQQAMASAIMRKASVEGSPPLAAVTPPMMVPSRMARKVAASTRALPAGSSLSARWSGRMPYLIGPNSAAMTPKPNSAANSTGRECSVNPATATNATPISASLRRRATFALSKRSAIWPPSAERKKKGAMKIAAESEMRAALCSLAIVARIRNPMAVFRKLSLKAEKNWHQKSGAKRREDRRVANMGRALSVGELTKR